MGRYLAGIASALLLIVGGILFWNSRAENRHPTPKAPQAAAAQAQVEDDDAPPPPPSADKSREQKRFGRYDKNGDNIITRAEMMESRRKAFEKLDANGDGRLSFDEWAIATAKKFDKADADHSGTLTPAEFATTRKQPSTQKKCSCGQGQDNGPSDDD